jgi:formylglycine-generating enzyme required for sulfatase activity
MFLLDNILLPFLKIEAKKSKRKTEMADIFLSYSSKDKERVKPLVLALEREGWSVWWDRRTLAGDTFDRMIDRELKGAKCLIVVWSLNSINSDWVREEATYGKSRNALFPARIDHVDIPLGFGLIQAVDLSEWTGSESDTEFQHLVESISAKIGRNEVTSKPGPSPQAQIAFVHSPPQSSTPDQTEERVTAEIESTTVWAEPADIEIKVEIDPIQVNAELPGSKTDKDRESVEEIASLSEKEIAAENVPSKEPGNHRATEVETWQEWIGPSSDTSADTKASPGDDISPEFELQTDPPAKRHFLIAGAGLLLVIALIAVWNIGGDNKPPPTGGSSVPPIEMVTVPTGSFMMGSPPDEQGREADEGPQHQVTLRSFEIGKHEVTQELWQTVMGSNPSGFKGDKLPVENVSWNDVQEFCRRLNEKLGLTGSNGYRLPTEAEWEYAARAGTTTPFAFGQTISPDIVNYDGNYPYGNGPKGLNREKTVPVGSLGRANNWGIHDMHGNVWEWCEDHWHDNYNGAPTDGRAWLGQDMAAYRVFRGGSWFNGAVRCRSARRLRYEPGGRGDDVGFRLSRTLP